MMRLAGFIMSIALTLLPNSAASVSVAYAASLVAVMEGPFAAALRRDTGVTLVGEPKGSRALANLIAAGLRRPDVFISADPALMNRLTRSYVIFASARMVIAYSTHSAHRALFDQLKHGGHSILDVLTAPGMRVGRTDPALDPKGARTVRAIELLGRHYHRADQARALLRAAQLFPEEDLAVRVETGQLDAGFFYSIEAARPGLQSIDLPADSDLGQAITFAVAELGRPPHPSAARTFLSFLLHGEGRRILERAGLRFLQHPRMINR